MCRIAGIVNPSFSTERLKQAVKEMCTTLSHGGPDDEGIYVCEHDSLVLGHRRLSIIDTSNAGHQPMSYQDNRYQISYNGEIYNYLELREQLKTLGHNFKTHSDTEVILAAFAEWHTQSFEKLNGMFSFAIWDDTTQELFLARDGSGIKPLYYAITPEGLAFASEIKAFQHIPYLQQANDNWKVFLLAFGHLPEPVTTLKNVKPLTKGSFIQYHVPTQTWISDVFHKFSFKEAIGDRKTAIQSVKETFQKAVRRHMISDAPIGVFLSGGLDSSLIALLAGEGDKIDLNTLSIYFSDKEFSEKKYQDIVQERLKGTQQQFLLQEKDFDEYFPCILQQMDQPSCDGINTWFISKYARQAGLKAVLSGIGGDELFGGYPSFERISAAISLQRLPNRLLNAFKKSSIKQLRRLTYLSIDGTIGKYLFLRGQFVPVEIAQQLDASESEIFNLLSNLPLENNHIEELSAFNQASWMEFNLYMQNQLLRDADVMSMAHGLEIRVPFLDKELISLAMSIHSDVKYAGERNKQLLIDTFNDILPKAIWDRPKMGFSFPFRNWMLNNAYVKEKVLSNGKTGEANYRQFAANKMHWSQLMALLHTSNN
ncbi:asparagine synthase (glutamine-hydrolyzing) [Ferruginibacter albus]|uniref:asparagine synthase (glutamine-hydrolyzing) n=1 Tax=Ferruginibacter albus TaxID=2875540 RepID=UPI001CC612ED|nr:asparagine synthase (glutamine-hydrolyzing) [Ferruginibacter albus]UAY53472.1 asparagine synthase (glutamine-hydrolyzing) [Ferruginibacter albus]